MDNYLVSFGRDSLLEGGHDSFLKFFLKGGGDCGLEMQFKRGPARYSLLPALQSECVRNKKLRRKVWRPVGFGDSLYKVFPALGSIQNQSPQLGKNSV